MVWYNSDTKSILYIYNFNKYIVFCKQVLKYMQQVYSICKEVFLSGLARDKVQ